MLVQKNARAEEYHRTVVVQKVVGVVPADVAEVADIDFYVPFKKDIFFIGMRLFMLRLHII